jgi:hypothetical protein
MHLFFKKDKKKKKKKENKLRHCVKYIDQVGEY